MVKSFDLVWSLSRTLILWFCYCEEIDETWEECTAAIGRGCSKNRVFLPGYNAFWSGKSQRLSFQAKNGCKVPAKLALQIFHSLNIKRIDNMVFFRNQCLGEGSKGVDCFRPHRCPQIKTEIILRNEDCHFRWVFCLKKKNEVTSKRDHPVLEMLVSHFMYVGMGQE